MQTLYLENATMMFRLALKYTNCPSDAHDVVGGVCEALIHKIETLRELPPGLQIAYIHSAIKHQALMLLRKRMNEDAALQLLMEQALLEEDWDADLTDVIAIYRCTLDEIVNHIKLLPEADRIVLRLRYFDELSDAEIANVLGLRNSTARSRIRRAMLRLQAIMEVNDDA